MNKYQESINAMWEEVEQTHKKTVRTKTEDEHWTELKKNFMVLNVLYRLSGGLLILIWNI